MNRNITINEFSQSQAFVTFLGYPKGNKMMGPSLRANYASWTQNLKDV